MTKNSKKVVVIALLLALTMCLYYVAGTYAKYTSQATANSEIGVAKWAVKLGEVDIASGATDFSSELTLEPDSSTTVKAGKIAPGTTASGSFTIDPTGTEVAVKYSVEIGEIAYSGIAANKPNVTITKVMAGTTELTKNAAGKYEGNIALDGAAVEIKLTATWTSTSDAADTVTGYEAGTLTVPVTVTVEQAV